MVSGFIEVCIRNGKAPSARKFFSLDGRTPQNPSPLTEEGRGEDETEGALDPPLTSSIEGGGNERKIAP